MTTEQFIGTLILLYWLLATGYAWKETPKIQRSWAGFFSACMMGAVYTIGTWLLLGVLATLVIGVVGG